MSILEKARELAEAIGNAPELAELREKEMVMYNDNTAQGIINEFQEKQKELHMAHMQGLEITEEQKASVTAIEEKMKNNPNISAYMDAQNNFESILKSVNMIITRAISGQEGDECGPSCGGGCC